MEYDNTNTLTLSQNTTLTAADLQSEVSISNLAYMVANGKSDTAEDVNVAKVVAMTSADTQQQKDLFISDTIMMVARKVKLPNVPRQRAWTYNFDGHTFYVLDLGSYGDWIYDESTQTWSKWDTKGFNGRWDFINGYQWNAANKTIGGALYYPMLYELNHASHLDGGFRKIQYKTTAILPSTKREGQRVDTARLLVSIEAPLIEEATATLEWSDDNGKTWSASYSKTLVEGVQSLDWRSLGMLKNSGRIFNISSEGALLRLDSFIVRIDGVE